VLGEQPVSGGAAPEPDWAAVARGVKARALELGFDLVGIADATPFAGAEARTLAWLAQGRAAGMAWLTAERVRWACDPEALLPGARSFVSVGIGYRPAEERPNPPTRQRLPYSALPPAREGGEPGKGQVGRVNPIPPGGEQDRGGQIARYARGRDYHDVLKPRLWALVRWLESAVGRSVGARVFVDAGPCPDRAVAQRAGLGFFGKNTNVLTRTHGSYVLLGALLTDLPLPADPPASGDCGSCTLCLDACPTGALPAPYQLDSNRCLSYLTIEHRGSIPVELRAAVGEHLFGCDVCQEVCPWNRLAAPTAEAAFAPEAGAGPDLDAATVLGWDEAAYRERLRGSPVKRAKFLGIRRNAALVAANAGQQRAIPALRAMLAEADPVVREQAAWALARLGTEGAGEGYAGGCPAGENGETTEPSDR
jgi:epoxyqueuosine reductase